MQTHRCDDRSGAFNLTADERCELGDRTVRFAWQLPSHAHCVAGHLDPPPPLVVACDHVRADSAAGRVTLALSALGQCCCCCCVCV